MRQVETPSGWVTGGPRILLRLEGAALFAGATAAYFGLGHPWWMYLVLFLAPDLAFAAYLAGSRAGAASYNAVHATLGPLALVAIGLFTGIGWVTGVALIWAAHVGIDRALGYGLKYAAGFHLTHLGPIGRAIT
jgi:hypothetical protein